jgi:p-aminobenzoyl-glutamate transporter AbgT
MFGFRSHFVTWKIFCTIFVLVFGLLGEGADGFKKGWWERLLGNYYFLTLILAFIGEFVTPVLGFEPYLL